MKEENKQQLNKIKTFLEKTQVNANLPMVDALDEINDSLKQLVAKEVPEQVEVQKIALEGVSVVTLKGDKGDTGEKGDKGDTGEQGLSGKDGLNGKDGVNGIDGNDGINGINGENGKDGSADTGEQIIDKINDDEDKQIKREKVEGLEDAFKSFDKQISSIPRGGGGGRGIQLYVNSVKKGLAQYIDIIPGSNITITDSLVGGLHSITISASAGGGFSTLAATETPDGIIKVFTFSGASAKPSFLVVDNVWMRDTTALGTVNWTWDNGTKKATLSITPVDEVFAIV